MGPLAIPLAINHQPSAMEYRRLGTTGVRVSRLALGGNFGGSGRSRPSASETEAQAIELMDRAFDAGINLFDTANAYGGGPQRELHRAVARGEGSGAAAAVELEVFNPIGPGPNDRGLSRRHILHQVDESLARLKTDRIDLYLIHEPDPETPLDETLAALDDLVRAGKVLYVGASNIEAWRLARGLWLSDVRRLVRFEWVQNSYSLLDRSAEREMFPLCEDTRVGFTAFSPLAGGWLSGKYRAKGAYPDGSRMTLRPEPYLHLESDKVFRGLEAFAEDARARGTDMTALAIAWVLHHPRVDAAIVGPRTPAHLDAALAALSVAIDDADAERLAKLF